MSHQAFGMSVWSGLGAIGILGGASAAELSFTDVTAGTGINHQQSYAEFNDLLPGSAFMTGGVAAGDFDNDGLTDLIFTRLGDNDIFYRNRGDGTFEKRTASAGFTIPTLTNGVVSGDIDNDGDLDLYITGGAGATRNYLYLNDGTGFFTDAGPSAAAALSNGIARNGQGASFGDINGDGYLDLVTSDWGNPTALSQSRLFLNRGATQPGVFDDVTQAAGIDTYRKAINYRFAPHLGDLDRDGHADLTFAADFETSQLFWNNGDGTFLEGTAAANVGTDYNGMGTAFADYDGDGYLDWFITNITQDPAHPGPFGGWNRLYRNNGDRTFTDVTQQAGVRDARWGWGTTFFDGDNDGDPDLIATNGYNGAGWVNDRTTLWRNDGGIFTDVSNAAGITDTGQGRGLIHLDYDNDGDLDLIIVNHEDQPIVYRNDLIGPGGPAADQTYLRLHTEGTLSNRDGIGAFITVVADLNDPHTRQVRSIESGSSFLSQNEHTAHFGLGDRASAENPVDLVTIEWTSGVVQHLHQVGVNQTLTVVEAVAETLAGDADFNGQLNADDIDWLFRAIADGDLYRLVFGLPAIAALDLNGDGLLDAADVDVLVGELLGTFPGDADLDGRVAQGDLDAVLNHWGQSGMTWATGDLNGNGVVEQGDLDAVLNFWGASNALPLASSIPEPAFAGLVAMGLSLGRHRRKA